MVRFLIEAVDVLLVTALSLTLGLIQLPTQQALRILSSGLKQPEHEANHSSAYSFKIKSVLRLTSTLPCINYSCGQFFLIITEMMMMMMIVIMIMTMMTMNITEKSIKKPK
jgi:hypothetical protein